MTLTTRWKRILSESWLVRLAALIAVLNTAQQAFGVISAWLPASTVTWVNAALGLSIVVASVIQQDVLHGTTSPTT